MLVTWTAVRIMSGREDEMPARLADLIRAAGIAVEKWPEAVKDFSTLFHTAVGAAQKLAAFMQHTGRKSVHGIRACRDLIT